MLTNDFLKCIMSSSVPSVGSPPPAPSQQSLKKSVMPKVKAPKPKSPRASKPRPAKASKPKSPKKVVKPKVPKAKTVATTPSIHPSYSLMIKKAIADLNEKKGSSRMAILKFVMSHYQLGDNQTKINSRIKSALKRGVISSELMQVKGVGASGSFRLGGSGTPKTVSGAKKSPKQRAPVAKKPSAKKVTPKKAKKAVTPKSAAVMVAVNSKPKETVSAAVSPTAAKPKATKTAKKTPKTIAKKTKTPKKMADGANKTKKAKKSSA